MKNFIKIMIAVLALTLMFGCTAPQEENAVPGCQESEPVETQSPSTPPQEEDVGISIPEGEGVLLSAWAEFVPQGESEELFSLPEIGLNDVLIQSKVTGEDATCYLLKKDGAHGCKCYLAVETSQGVWLYDLQEKGLDGLLYMCDTDGDEAEEIVVFQMLDCFGGAGQYISRIFKHDQGKLHTFFTAENESDTGYEAECLKDHQLKITNQYADCDVILDLSTKFAAEFHDELFDEDGVFQKNSDLWFDCFFEFIPEDVDSDGIYEIRCAQLLYLDDIIGTAKTTLKYSAENQRFEVIEADFVP